METYITICKIDSQREFAVWLRKLKQGLCINLERWDGEGDGRKVQREGIYVYLWLIHLEVWQKTTKFCKAIILQLKKKLKASCSLISNCNIKHYKSKLGTGKKTHTQRDITLPAKIHIAKAMFFPESWTIKNTEHQRTAAFKLWCWRRLLRVPWTAGDQTSQS